MCEEARANTEKEKWGEVETNLSGAGEEGGGSHPLPNAVSRLVCRGAIPRGLWTEFGLAGYCEVVVHNSNLEVSNP